MEDFSAQGLSTLLNYNGMCSRSNENHFKLDIERMERCHGTVQSFQEGSSWPPRPPCHKIIKYKECLGYFKVVLYCSKFKVSRKGKVNHQHHVPNVV